MINLETTYLGLQLKNPLVAASSGLTSSVSKIKELADNGIGAVVIKSVFEEQIMAEADSLFDPTVGGYSEAQEYIGAYVRSNSLDKHLTLIKEAKEAVDIPIIASVNCISEYEWVDYAIKLEAAGADAIEINIFILATDKDRDPNSIEDQYVSTVSSVVKAVKIPVAVKVAPRFINHIRLADRLLSVGVKGITMFNRFFEPDIDLENLKMSSASVFSNPGDIRRSLRFVGIVSGQIPNIEISASTGVHNGESVVKLLLAGSTTVQLCSTLYINGASVIGDILKYTEKFMEKWNFKTIKEFQGRLSYKGISDVSTYERSQFMKQFSSVDRF